MAPSGINPTRDDTWEWSVTINDKPYGVWDTKTGGEVESDEQTYKPGGMADPISLGGSVNVGNLIITRNYRLQRDHEKSQDLINVVGKAKVRAVGKALDRDGNSYGKPFTYNGTLKRVTFPTHDSTSNAAAMIEIEITVAGKPTGM
jgi:hypothetical protein